MRSLRKKRMLYPMGICSRKITRILSGDENFKRLFLEISKESLISSPGKNPQKKTVPETDTGGQVE